MKRSKFEYTIHNLFAHPVMEILHLMGFSKLGDRIHDATLPKSHNHAQESHNHAQEEQEDVAPTKDS